MNVKVLHRRQFVRVFFFTFHEWTLYSNCLWVTSKFSNTVQLNSIIVLLGARHGNQTSVSEQRLYNVSLKYMFRAHNYCINVNVL